MAYFSFNNKNIYYNVTGKGEPLLLLNGIMMSSLSWEPFVNALSTNNLLIRLDFIDQGKSDSLKDEYTQEIQVDLIKALIDHLNLKKVSIVGISYGGEVALQFAIKYENLINKLIIFNSVAYTNEELAKTGTIWNEFALKREVKNYFNATIPIIYSNQFKEENKEWMKNRESLLLNNVFNDFNFLDRMIRLTNSAEKYDVRNKLKQLQLEVLLIGSEADVLTPLSQQRLLNELITNSNLIIIPKVGHASMYEVPNLFVSIILGHLNNNFNVEVV